MSLICWLWRKAHDNGRLTAVKANTATDAAANYV